MMMKRKVYQTLKKAKTESPLKYKLHQKLFELQNFGQTQIGKKQKMQVNL